MKLSEYIAHCELILEEEGDLEVCYPAIEFLYEEIELQYGYNIENKEDIMVPVRTGPELTTNAPRIKGDRIIL